MPHQMTAARRRKMSYMRTGLLLAAMTGLFLAAAS